jgi:hypothetical protein
LKNVKCERDEDVRTELKLQLIISKSAPDITLKIYQYVVSYDFVVREHDTTTKICRDGIFMEKAENSSMEIYRNKLTLNHNTSSEILNVHFKNILSLKDGLLKLYDMYKFKHNDLHCRNVLFVGLKPKIIDFGASVMNHKFLDGTKFKVKPTRKTLLDFYDDFSLELQDLHSKFPVSDIHLSNFTSFHIFNRHTNFIDPKFIREISKGYSERVENTYLFSELHCVANRIFFKGKEILEKALYQKVFRETVKILTSFKHRENKSEGLLKYLFDIWNIYVARMLAYFYSVYLSDAVEWDKLVVV